MHEIRLFACSLPVEVLFAVGHSALHVLPVGAAAVGAAAAHVCWWICSSGICLCRCTAAPGVMPAALISARSSAAFAKAASIMWHCN